MTEKALNNLLNDSEFMANYYIELMRIALIIKSEEESKWITNLTKNSIYV